MIHEHSINESFNFNKKESQVIIGTIKIDIHFNRISDNSRFLDKIKANHI